MNELKAFTVGTIVQHIRTKAIGTVVPKPAYFNLQPDDAVPVRWSSSDRVAYVDHSHIVIVGDINNPRFQVGDLVRVTSTLPEYAGLEGEILRETQQSTLTNFVYRVRIKSSEDVVTFSAQALEKIARYSEPAIMVGDTVRVIVDTHESLAQGAVGVVVFKSLYSDRKYYEIRLTAGKTKQPIDDIEHIHIYSDAVDLIRAA